MDKRSLIKFSILLLIFCVCSAFGILLIKYNNAKREYISIRSIEMKNIDGNKVNIDTLSNNKLAPTVFFFFDPDCDLCVIEISKLLDVAEKIEGVNKIFVTISPRERVLDFLKDYPIGDLKYTHILLDTEFEFASQYDLSSPPSSVFYDNNGRYLTTHKGYAKPEVILDIINKAWK